MEVRAKETQASLNYSICDLPEEDTGGEQCQVRNWQNFVNAEKIYIEGYVGQSLRKKWTSINHGTVSRD